MKKREVRNTAFWQTADGTKIRICDMTTRHLSNAEGWIKKRAMDVRLGIIEERGAAPDWEDCIEFIAVSIALTWALDPGAYYRGILTEIKRRAPKTNHSFYTAKKIRGSYEYDL